MAPWLNHPTSVVWRVISNVLVTNRAVKVTMIQTFGSNKIKSSENQSHDIIHSNILQHKTSCRYSRKIQTDSVLQ